MTLGALGKGEALALASRAAAAVRSDSIASIPDIYMKWQDGEDVNVDASSVYIFICNFAGHSRILVPTNVHWNKPNQGRGQQLRSQGHPHSPGAKVGDRHPQQRQARAGRPTLPHACREPSSCQRLSRSYSTFMLSVDRQDRSRGTRSSQSLRHDRVGGVRLPSAGLATHMIFKRLLQLL